MPTSIEELRTLGEAFKPRLSFVQRFLADGKLLEVGASHGTFAHLAQRNGFEVDAMEMDPDCCRFMQENGINAICASSLESAESSLAMYDVIALYHVIEHLQDSKMAIRLLARHLSVGGILVIATPNPESLQFRGFGRFWVNLDAPRHLSLIPLKTLTKEAEQNGLELACATCSGPEAMSHQKWSWEGSLDNLLTSIGIMPAAGIRSIKSGPNGNALGKGLALGQRLLSRASAIGLARVLNLAFAPLERSGYRGSSYVAVFRRKNSDGK